MDAPKELFGVRNGQRFLIMVVNDPLVCAGVKGVLMSIKANTKISTWSSIWYQWDPKRGTRQIRKRSSRRHQMMIVRAYFATTFTTWLVKVVSSPALFASGRVCSTSSLLKWRVEAPSCDRREWVVGTGVGVE